MGIKLPSEPANGADNVVLSSRSPDGSVTTGHFLPREHAEQLARIYGGMYPEQTFWIEPVKMDETRSFMRVRRRRPRPSAANPE